MSRSPGAAAALDGAPAPASIDAACWALLAGNFAIGCGVMVVPGALNDLSRSFDASVAVAGQLITLGAVVVALGAPLLAALVSGWDRRRLLALSLVWFALGHALALLTRDMPALMAVRGASMLAAAVFTPQAAAAIGALAPPERRARAIIFIFLGWSAASVFGMPMHAYIGEAFGWRWAFALVALLSSVAALGVWRALPSGLRPGALSLRAWRGVLTHPALMAVIAVTALAGAGQFTLFAYFAPFYRDTLGASAAGISLLFAWFGAFGLAGNLLLSRHIERIGAARAVNMLLLTMGASLLAWPFAHTPIAMALVLLPWALGSFASNSAQQARLGVAAPAMAPALMALNSSAIYAGQAIGAAGGGALVLANQAAGRATYAGLERVGLAWLALALALSLWAARRMRAAQPGPTDRGTA